MFSQPSLTRPGAWELAFGRAACDGPYSCKAERAQEGPESARNFDVWEKLLDGRSVQIRAVRPDDRRALQEGLNRLSAESSYLRFFAPKREFSQDELTEFTELDFEERVALVAVLHDSHEARVIGVGRYILCDDEPGPVAEMAFAVDDAHHGRGVATILFHHLLGIARAAGVLELRAFVLEENRAMLHLFARTGLPQVRSRDGGVVELRFPLTGGPFHNRHAERTVAALL